MKYRVRRFKSLEACLRELERFVRNGEHLQTGKPLAQFGGLRSREILANWLICVALNFTNEENRFSFCTDPLGGDGIICDAVSDMTWPTEHVLVPRTRSGDAEDVETNILKAINNKQNKGGAAYASGKILVVFSNAGGGVWFPNRVTKKLPEVLHFKEVWAISLQGVEEGEYVYGVTLLDVSDGNAPTWRVRIASDFGSWKVEPVQ